MYTVEVFTEFKTVEDGNRYMMYRFIVKDESSEVVEDTGWDYGYASNSFVTDYMTVYFPMKHFRIVRM